MPFIGVQPASALLTSADIQDGQITTAKIANDAVDNTKLDLSSSYDFSAGLTLGDNLTFDVAGKGVHLGVTSATASNLMDDYEEGEFVATMLNSVTLTSGYDSLAYTKIGRQVTVTGQIQINSDNSNSTTVISNLPFTQFTQSSPNEDADRAFCAVRLYNHDMANDAQYVGAFTAEGTTNLYFVNVRDNASNVDLQANASGYLMFTITYFTS